MYQAAKAASASTSTTPKKKKAKQKPLPSWWTERTFAPITSEGPRFVIVDGEAMAYGAEHVAADGTITPPALIDKMKKAKAKERLLAPPAKGQKIRAIDLLDVARTVCAQAKARGWVR